MYNAKALIDFFKDGKELEIEDEHGNDVTAEFFSIAAFGYIVPASIVATLVEQELLEDMVWAGGYENWNIRKNMGRGRK
ncbi:MAG TPA: hypothetical protein VIS27_09600 [Yeosuana sp.]